MKAIDVTIILIDGMYYNTALGVMTYDDQIQYLVGIGRAYPRTSRASFKHEELFTEWTSPGDTNDWEFVRGEWISEIPAMGSVHDEP